MRAVAIKKGQSLEQAVGFREMGTLRCEGCGEEFSLSVLIVLLVSTFLSPVQLCW
jgi:hypothetical protein